MITLKVKLIQITGSRHCILNFNTLEQFEHLFYAAKVIFLCAELEVFLALLL